MKAMIFAAGLGTRLRPLTDDRPKALVEINGVTLLERVIHNLADYGFTDIVVNVHHFADKIIAFLDQNHSFGLNIAISDERDLLLETGGGVLHARDFLDGNEPFLVHNVDILSTINLAEFYRTHCDSQALATILVKDRPTQRYFLFNDNDALCGWTNIKTGETKPSGINASLLQHLAFGGIHVMSPKIFPLLHDFAEGNPVFSITPFYIQACRNHFIQGYQPTDGYRWLDVGKPESIQAASELFPL